MATTQQWAAAGPAAAPVELRASPGLFTRAGRALLRDRLTMLAIAIFVALCLVAVFADAIGTGVFKTTPEAINPLLRLQPPSERFPLGTDEYGRSQIVRLMHGARVSLTIGLLAAFVNMTLGVFLGIAAAYYGKAADDAINALINTLRSMPTIILLLVIFVLFRPPWWGLAIVLGLISWMGTARLVRGEVYSLKERDFVTAARAMGASDGRIVTWHIWPNVLPIVIIILGIDIGGIILFESAISYLGLGVQPPVASWGNMLTNAQNYLFKAPWLMLAPGFMIALTVLCLYLVGDGVRDALDPRLKE
jgi:peptide/nickel transport system permease protein